MDFDREQIDMFLTQEEHEKEMQANGKHCALVGMAYGIVLTVALLLGAFWFFGGEFIILR